MWRWLDDRLRIAAWSGTAMRKIFPDHWTFLLGEVALFCFVVLLATGVFLTLFYVPDSASVVYDGAYRPLAGREVSAAYRSVLDLSFEVRAGLLIRQIHHWAALVFVAAIVLHLTRIFFTGAYRRPREVNWLVGLGLLTLALAMGMTGYSLPDDLLSGTGLRIMYSAAMSVPFVGPYLAFLLFGGEFPTASFVSRLFVFHVMLLPALLIGGIVLHLAILWRQKHTQYRGPGRTERNVVGRPFWPVQVFRSTGLLLLTAAVLALLGGLVQINPIWAYGPFDPTTVSAPAQPDWYIGWLEGLLRLMPSIEFTVLGITIPSLFVPAIVVPAAAFVIALGWPFVEAWVSGDHDEHQLLDSPIDAPVRTAIGVGAITFLVILTLGGANDVLAILLHASVESLTNALRIGLLVVPPIAAIVTWIGCRELRRRRATRPDGGHDAVRLDRTARGGFEERPAERQSADR